MTAPEELYCVSCGTIVSGDDRFCEACGARVSMPGDDHRDHTELDLGIVAGVTDRGRVHERNEDALFVAAASGHAVAVVCDGVSTSDAPHAASQLAADVAGRALVEALARRTEPDPAPDWDGPAATAAAIDAAQRAVAGIVARTSAATDPPACTYVSALWDGVNVTVGWVGDSRAYWVSNDEARCITVDDSWAQAQRTAGSMESRAIARDPRAHMITRWLGADAPDLAPGITTFAPTHPGRVVVCSDGLWNYTPAAHELAALTESAPDRASSIDVAQRLTRAALAAGGHDNITVAVVSIDPDVSLKQKSETS